MKAKGCKLAMVSQASFLIAATDPFQGYVLKPPEPCSGGFCIWKVLHGLGFGQPLKTPLPGTPARRAMSAILAQHSCLGGRKDRNARRVGRQVYEISDLEHAFIRCGSTYPDFLALHADEPLLERAEIAGKDHTPRR